jgi:toxin FitB
VSFLVDTSVISEVRKGKRCHPRVAAWYESIDDADLYLSVLILGEIRTGIELARSRDSEQVARLES